MYKKISIKEILVVFLLALITRYLFAYFSGVDIFFNSDWGRYNLQSDNILLGKFNLETELFISAPLFPYLVAGMKYIFGSHYIPVLEGLQITLSAVSAIFLMKTAQVIFSNYRTSLLSGIIYAVYPITLYYTHIFGQESIFQSTFIISVYYISSFLIFGKKRDLLFFSLYFSIALLTKSHIILIVPFLLASIIIVQGMNRKSYIEIAIVLGIIFLMSFPYGLYNKIVNGVYVISSTGYGGHFLNGHNDDFYIYVISPPLLGTPEHTKLKTDYEVLKRLRRELDGLSHKEKQTCYLIEGVQWVKDNPIKFLELSWYNLKSFISPGFDVHHHPFKKWLFTLIISSSVFLLAYIEIVRRCIVDFRKHLVIISIFLGMLCFSLVFYSQNRFRVITIEPFYLIYACSALVSLGTHLRHKLILPR